MNFRKLSGESTRRYYVQHYTGLPRELHGTTMEKEDYLDALTSKMLNVVGVLPRRRHANAA